MFRNYLTTSWRALLRNKRYTLINIAGLSIGIASSLLIFLVIHYETSFDRFHAKRDQIFRVVTTGTSPEGTNLDSGVPFPTSEGLRLDYPQLSQVAGIFQNGGQITVLSTHQKFREEKTFFAEPSFFNIFDFPWLDGNKVSALSEPNTVVLSRSIAEKYFGQWKDAVGKSIKYENRVTLKVTGVLEDVPNATDFPLEVVISYATLKNTDLNGNLQDWVSTFSDNECFIVLPPQLSEAQFNRNLVSFVQKHKPPEYVKDGMGLQPLSNMHYDTRLEVFSGKTFSRDLIRALALVGLFLLVIACVNFINLATAQAVTRSREVGIRKALGGVRRQLVFQFLGEIFIISLFSLFLGITIARVVLPYLNQLLETRLSTAFLADPVVLLFLLLILLATTLLSGLYPALVLSGFHPIQALKSRVINVGTKNLTLRRGLVIFQFCIAQVLTIGTLVIIHQMSYFRNKPLGFEKNAILNVGVPNDSLSALKMAAFKNQVLAIPGVKDASYSFSSPSDDNNWNSDLKFDHSTKKTDFNANLKWVDAEYFKLYNLQFVAGHPYEASDTARAFVVNETFLKKVGIRHPEEAIGKYLNFWDKIKAPIVGVVKDFHVLSLRREIPPVAMSSWKGLYQIINIKLTGDNVRGAQSEIERLWNSTYPDYTYSSQFLDAKLNNFYKNDNQLSQLYKIFAGIAIFISCLGLFGLVSFMAVQRTREVGIRKTLGASVANIVYLFSREFTVLITVAFFIAAPVGWYFMHNWLQNFTYRIRIGPDTFLLTLLASIAIAWATVGYKAVRAALANPVKSLRNE